MGEPKWTPGPWEWRMHETYNLPALYGANGEVVMGFGDDEPYYPTAGKPPNHHDQALIAAAPDLYEACEAALHAFNTNPTDRFLTPEEEDAIEKLRSALARARGEDA